MDRKRNNRKKPEGLLGAVIFIVLVGAAICIFGVAIISLLIGEQTIQLEDAGYGLVAVLLLSSFVTARLLIKKRKGKEIISAAIAVALMLGLLVLGNMMWGVGSMDGIGQTVLIVTAGSGCAVLMKAKPSRNKKYHSHKI